MADTDNPDMRIGIDPGKGYALSGKIMLSAIVVLFAVVVFMVGLHLYARWYLVRLRRRQLERRRGRRASRAQQIFMYVDSGNPGAAADRGLELPVLNSLPVYVHYPKAEQPPQECAVCLSEFGNGEVVRLLPDCTHTFHIDCIDMWFNSHSTCPLCRSKVEFVPERVYKVGRPMTEPVGMADGSELGSSSGSGPCATCRRDEGSGDADTTSLGSRRKGLDLAGVRIEVPPPSRRMNESENELTQSSPSTRFLAFKRILSMGRKSPASGGLITPSIGGRMTSCAEGTSHGGTELDLESGLSESTRQPSRVQPPVESSFGGRSLALSE